MRKALKPSSRMYFNSFLGNLRTEEIYSCGIGRIWVVDIMTYNGRNCSKFLVIPNYAVAINLLP
jgi:hypothetical protein